MTPFFILLISKGLVAWLLFGSFLFHGLLYDFMDIAMTRGLNTLPGS